MRGLRHVAVLEVRLQVAALSRRELKVERVRSEFSQIAAITRVRMDGDGNLLVFAVAAIALGGGDGLHQSIAGTMTRTVRKWARAVRHVKVTSRRMSQTG